MQAQSRRQLRFILLWRRQKHRRSNVCYGFGSFNAQCWAKEIWAQIQWILWQGSKAHERLTATGAVQIKRVSTSFCSSSRSVRNSANYSMKSQRFYCFIHFAWNADIHMSGKRRNSTIDPKWEDDYLWNGQLCSSRCIKTVIIFQQHFVFNIEMKGSV